MTWEHFKKSWRNEFAVCTLFILLLPSLLSAQQPYIPFRHLSNIDGLSQNHILAILQDDQGFMWFGTSEGLNRFDGYEFTNYSHRERDSTSIPNDIVNVLIKDHLGDLWLGSVMGLTKYNRTTNSFTSYIHDPNKKDGISWGRVNAILEDAKGNFWIAFITGMVDYFDRSTGTFTHFPIASDVSSNGYYGEATSLYEDHNGDIWIGTFQGITILNQAHKLVSKFIHDSKDPHSLTSDIVHFIFRDKEGTMWIATDSGINRYDSKENHFTRFQHDNNNDNSLATNVVRRLSEDKEGRLWLCTENGGLDIFDKSKNIFYHFKENSTNKAAINDNSLYSIYRDRFDNMWVGTNAQGVNFYDRSAKPFVIFQAGSEGNTTLSHNKVTSVAEQPGKGFWISTDGGGINFYDPKTNLFKHYRHQVGNANGIQSDFSGVVAWDKKDQCVWIGTWGGGLSRLDPRTDRFTNYSHHEEDSTSLAGNDLWRLYFDAEGTLYVGTIGGGVSIFDKNKNRFTNYSTSKGLAEKNAVSFLRDTRGYLWVGGWERGVSKMDIVRKKIVPIPSGLKMLSAFSITEDSLKRIWFTSSAGIHVYDDEKKSVLSYTIKDGLPGSNVNEMLDDHHGNYWLSTNKGIVKFSVATKKFRVYTIEDGLPTNQFSERLLLASDGRMFFGSVNGLVVFHPDSIKTNTNIPPVVITDFKIFNKSVPIGGKENILTKPISETKELWLPHEYNFISIHFVALNYTSSQRNEYAYQLKGFDNDWVQSSSQRAATYTNLDAGTYTFHVKASNNDGLWNEEGAQLIIHVLPAWWQTWWFRSFIIAGIFGTAIFISILRTKRIEKANLILEATVNKKTKELQETNQILIGREEEIISKNKTLSKQSEELAAQNEELIQIQEEISAQRDLVSHQKENLEDEVARRTQELVEYNHQLEQFAFISAHNLRAPVARILGLGHLLSHAKNNAEEKEKIYPKLIHTTQELDSVVKDLNAILELKKNSESFITDVDFNDELSMIRANLENEIAVTKTVITSDFNVDKIRTVKPYMDSIFYNLVSNAIKYRHPDRPPVIHLHTEKIKNEICLSISDNGLGIDVSLFRKKLFTLYSRFHEHVEGKGMGLYLVKTQLTALGGRIEVESEVGKGTRFKAYFKENNNS